MTHRGTGRIAKVPGAAPELPRAPDPDDRHAQRSGGRSDAEPVEPAGQRVGRKIDLRHAPPRRACRGLRRVDDRRRIGPDIARAALLSNRIARTARLSGPASDAATAPIGPPGASSGPSASMPCRRTPATFRGRSANIAPRASITPAAAPGQRRAPSRSKSGRALKPPDSPARRVRARACPHRRSGAPRSRPIRRRRHFCRRRR